MELEPKSDTIDTLERAFTMHLPLFFRTDHMPCLVIGGGKVAAHKVGILLHAGCTITLIAPEVEDSLRQFGAYGEIRWLNRDFQEGDCTGFHLVVAATDCAATNRAVSSEARQKGIPVNVVDTPDLSTVIFGASWSEGPLTVSVSTGGAAPFMAAAVRDHLAESACGMGYWVESAGRFRTAVRGAVRDSREKECLYQRFIACTRGRAASSLPQSRDLNDWLAYFDHVDSSE